MSLVKQAFRGAAWLGAFRFLSQSISWVATVIIARILLPEDYGLMEMATILTGYVVLFSELGLGSAIIQRETATEEELSSLFWLIFFWGVFLSMVCLLLAYPTAMIFHDPRVLRITQAVAILYVIGSLMIVPLGILNRNLEFKTIGFLDAISVLTSSFCMVVIAKTGGGVWTLIGGSIIKEFTKCVLLFSITPWKPRFRINFPEVKSYLHFGLFVAGSRSMGYIYSKSDSFFGGRLLGAGSLGYYSMAQQLSSIPNEKIVSLINNVSFPIFARYQDKRDEFNSFFLKLTNMIAFIVLPIYLGGFILAKDLIPGILGDKWVPVIFPFKVFCLSQILISISTPVSWVNIAQNRPQWGLYIGVICMFIMPLSFYFAAKKGLDALVLPWVTVDPALRIGFTYVTLRKINVRVVEYLKCILNPLLGALVMALFILLLKYISYTSGHIFSVGGISNIIVYVVSGVVLYCSYTYIFNKSVVLRIKDLLFSK